MLEIVNDEAARRWQARLDGELAGYAEYRATSTRIVFTHTVVEARFEGRGVGSRLARAALDDGVARQLRIVPICPFIHAYLERHREYDAWVDWPARRPAASPG
jgi:predicted GNAT family acetyltransferase